MAIMTETNESGFDLGPGILIPKLNQQFSVEFRDTADQPIAENLTRQVLSISGFNVIRSELRAFGLDNMLKDIEFSIDIEDDMTGLAMDVVWEYFNSNNDIIVVYKSLDGNNNPLEIVTFLATVSGIRYAARRYNMENVGYATKLLPSGFENLIDNSFTSKLLRTLSNIFILTELKPVRNPSTVIHTVQFSATSIERISYKSIKGGV